MSIAVNSALVSLTKLTPSNCVEKQPAKQLQSVMKNHLTTLQLTSEAIGLFRQGVMPDPLVGENACQIRASMYTSLASDPEVMQTLGEVATRVDEIRNRLARLPIAKQHCSFLELLEENEAHLLVPSFVLPIVTGHVLTVSKDSSLAVQKEEGAALPRVGLKEENDPRQLNIMTVSTAKVMIQKARQLLSQLSLEHLQQEAELLGIEGPQNVIVDSLRFPSTPLLPGMKIILASLKKRGTPIVLKTVMMNPEGVETGTATLIARADRFGRLQIVDSIDPRTPAMMITAVSISAKPRTASQLREELIAVGIEPIILANCAAHPQYGGMSKKIEPPRSEERETLREMALEVGLCERNPDLCQIYHICAGGVG